MKNRKTVVVAFLLVAAMLLGVGYAALTDTLTITGEIGANTSASQTEFDADVYFKSTAVTKDDTGNQAASQILEGRDDAKITAQHFTVKEQIVIVEYVIANDHAEFNASVAPNVAIDGNVDLDNDGADHDPIFTVSWKWDDAETGAAGTKLIPAKGSATLYVVIELDETPQEAHAVTFDISFTATAVEPGA